MSRNTRCMATCGVLLAASFVLSFFKIPGLPFGGSVTLFSMVPVIMAGCIYGTKWGLLTSFCYALLQLMQSAVSSKSFILDVWWQTTLMIFLDFFVAFAFLGIGGMFVKREENGAPIKNRLNALRGAGGAAVVAIIRYAAHTVSGFILYGSYAEWFFTDEFTNSLGSWAIANLTGSKLAWFYSLVYNGLYMIPEIVITTIGVYVLMRILPRIVKFY